MSEPPVDFRDPMAIVKEIFDSDESVRRQFQDRYAKQVVEFCEVLAPAFARFGKMADEIYTGKQAVLVCAFIHGILDDLVTSVKLLTTGKQTASGNLFRQSVEGIFMAVMSAHRGLLEIGKKECAYWELVYAQAKEVEGNLAARQFANNWDRLGLNKDAAEQWKTALEKYHQHSHAGPLAIACRMELAPGGAWYIGGHFDEAKTDAYTQEFRQRIELAKLTVQTIDAVWPDVRAIAKEDASAKPASS